MILLSGENSSIASYLLPILRDSYQVCSFSPDKGDMFNDDFLEKIFSDIAPTYFINLEQIDNHQGAEIYREWAYNINGFAPGKIADICKKHNIFFIHISTTDFYHARSDQYSSEEVEPEPLSVFEDSKLLGERLIRESGCNYNILRIPTVFGRNDHLLVPMMKSMIAGTEIPIIKNQLQMPLFAADAADIIYQLVGKKVEGIYNCSGSESISTYEFLFRVFDLYNSICGCAYQPIVKEIPHELFRSEAELPLYNLINSDKLYTLLKFTATSYDEAISRCIKEDCFAKV